jgi:hypothetical protein
LFPFLPSRFFLLLFSLFNFSSSLSFHSFLFLLPLFRFPPSSMSIPLLFATSNFYSIYCTFPHVLLPLSFFVLLPLVL